MGLYINQNSNTKIFKSETNDHSNQEIFHENYFVSMVNEQRQLNKKLTLDRANSTKINEMQHEALLLQISDQEKLLKEMHRKLLEYEQTTKSMHKQMKEQAKINNTLLEQRDLQNLYHQTTMERLDQHEAFLKEQLQKKEQSIAEHENVYLESAQNQKIMLNEFLDNQSKLMNELQLRESKFTEQYNTQQKELKEHFHSQNNLLEKQIAKNDANFEKLERKLDFLKASIFERAADLSEKLDEHVKKITSLFIHLFTKQERLPENSLKESPSNEREKLNI